MKYEAFVGFVQERARLGSQGEAVRAIHATLETLGERITPQEAQDLAAQLPKEIGDYLKQGKGPQRFDLQEFFMRVGAKESEEIPEAAFHARAVISVLVEAVTVAEMMDVIDQLPDDYRPLFDSGAEGEMDVE